MAETGYFQKKPLKIMLKLILTNWIICISLISCEKSTTSEKYYGSLELIFKARFGQNPLLYGKEYNYFDIGNIVFSKTDFYYSSLKLLNNGDSTLVDDVNYIALMNHHKSIELAEEGLRILYDKVPIGHYDAVDFYMGLSSDQNATKPSDYPLHHPMGDGSRYHPAFNSYIFSKTEGVFKNSHTNAFAYHPGFDNSSRLLHFNHHISIENNQKIQIIIEIDYQKMFQVNGTPIDIAANPQIYYFSAFMMSFVDRFQDAITIK